MIELALAARRVLLARSGKQDDEVGMVGVADEVLGAVDDEVIALLYRARLHAAQIGTGLRLGHGQALDTLAPHGRQQVALALLTPARQQDVGRPPDTAVLQGVACVAQLFLVQHPADAIQSAAADLGGHVGRVQAGGECLGLELLAQLLAQYPAFLHLALVRHQLLAHECARRRDDQLLFLAQRKIHRCLLRRTRGAPDARRRPRRRRPPPRRAAVRAANAAARFAAWLASRCGWLRCWR